MNAGANQALRQCPRHPETQVALTRASRGGDTEDSRR